MKPDQVAQYEIKKTVTGSSIKYDCLKCGVRLTSGLMEAGNFDHCPDCGTKLIVPGTLEKAAESQRQLLAEEERQKQRVVKKADAQQQVKEKLAEQSERQKGLHLNRDPLKEWLLYATIIGVLLAACTGAHLARAVTSDQSGLCAMIFGLFFLGIALNFRAVNSLKHEFVCAALLVEKLNTRKGFAEIITATPAGVFHRHIKDLVKIAKHDPNVSQDSLITLLFSKMMARSRIIDVLSGVLVSLGLIGTIVGLISMTNGLSGTLDSLGEGGDATALMAGMRTTMQGLGTAFYTTLVGAILGSVVLRVLNNVYTSNVDHFVSYIASLTEVQITPRLRKSSRTSNQEVIVGEIVQ